MIAALPTIGTVEDAQKEADDLVLWSVTTIIGVLDKPALIPWAVGLTAERAVARLQIIQRRLAEEGEAEAVAYVKGLRWHNDGRLSASQLGTAAHSLFDRYALSGSRPTVDPELHPDHAHKGSVLDARDVHDLNRMLDQFDRFLNEFQPEYEATEVVIFHPNYGYAGQADAFMKIGGIPLICDYKTSAESYYANGKPRAPYPEVGLQLAAYRFGRAAAIWRARRYESQRRRYYLLSPAERAMAVPVPEVQGGIAIHVSPERLGVFPVRCDDVMFDYFLHCLEVARFVFNDATHVVGNPMMPPFPMPADTSDPFEGLPG